MDTAITWILIVAGAALILLEVVLGAISGFDFLLIGSALLAGGLLGLILHHPMVGLAAAGVLSLLYVLVGRRQIRGRLRRPGLASNTDALLGRTVAVSEEVREDHAGRVRHEGEEWRALLDAHAAPPASPIPAGARARVTRVDGVTVYVVPAGETGSTGKETP
jgi:membrane protein implicated in regulation of membrane protease activity